MTGPTEPPAVADTPLDPAVAPARFERVVAAIGNLARPFTIYAIGYASAKTILDVGARVAGGTDGAVYLAAVAAILGLVIGARALENMNAVRQGAKVDTAKARAGVLD